MNTNIITLMRHGQVAGSAGLYGHTDIALSEQGYRTAMARLQQLHQAPPITRIISSPLVRCQQVAREFSIREQIPLQLDNDFMEMHFGHWDGMAFSDVQDWQALEAFWDKPAEAAAPGGETLAQFAGRVINAWDRLLDENHSGHQLLLCHGGVIRIVIAHLLQLDWRNAALFRQLNIDYTSHTRILLADHPHARPVIQWIGATH
ncbi:alpha-ribazole phosphatase family protein [Cellvibrio japonicus]|uniref:Fructose-26-bisphosphatase n=1 Tax=Cellvibrio japonicus (strain Ueda107) TaxID=498211 RepID=B3PC84_CELJU|nr:alpha-ribazole phosphatase family protein [Cellvibrio japonicus]ACE84605.1 fructose-2;6-bisphosphatase [Cellvibrio japonicus Ueda107]QEI13221.1 alpha-ribazole phosphatase family protein [Cellvibrio japonicus]QEI16795.1 alpha-ribazole phosphatase family protein [Cellvibrio japonicus]QEI20373.1 alpha-ribazole phosphatase family protein [Cellvibrio japonicus]